MINSSKYKVIEMIKEGPRFVFCRGERKSDGVPIIMKTVLANNFSVENLERLRNEFEIIKNLNLRGVLKAYAIEKIEDNIALIFEDMGGDFLDSLIRQKKFSTLDFLEISTRIVDTLCQLHQSSIIHKNIKSSNIIFNIKTNEVKLVGFDVATILPQEVPTYINSNTIQEDLLYISPEQTGRMNRTIDFRTDFYSLGVTFYELATGKLPFQALGFLELIHSHMARKPESVSEIDAIIPMEISQIISKMMAKIPEERYQSAAGLLFDLNYCLDSIKRNGEIHGFNIASQDVSRTLQIAQGLYGRKDEVEILREILNRASGGSVEVAIISGESGTGKTSLVKELNKPVTNKKGHFISGKFDQLKKNIPYSALIFAFQELVRDILTESKTSLSYWEKALLNALGSNGQIIIDVIPDVELIIGPQPPVVELGPVESQNRFKMLLLKFINVFCKKAHPLVIFLDDLQWADMATTKMVDLVLNEKTMRYFMFIGAYRSNVAEKSHPWPTLLEDLTKNGFPINNIEVGPLQLENINSLIADTINREYEQTMPLTKIVLTKTNGNPLFLKQFLKNLYDEKLLYLNSKKERWEWDIESIEKLKVTDNVVELLIKRVSQLPWDTQQVIRLASCVGATFDVNLLSRAMEISQNDISNILKPALLEGVIMPISISYEKKNTEEIYTQNNQGIKFIHDRVQQAIYTLIDEEERKELNFKIGMTLLNSNLEYSRESKVYEVVGHLNEAKELLKQKDTRHKIAALNLEAGRMAKQSAAYEMSFEYLNNGMDMLGYFCWQDQYDMSLMLHEEAAEVAFLLGHFDEMESLIDTVIQNARSVNDEVNVCQLRVLGRWSQNKLFEALDAALSILKVLGVDIDINAKLDEISVSVKETQLLLVDKDLNELIGRPEMSDPVNRSILRIIKDAAYCAYSTRFELFVQLIIEGVKLTLRFGNTKLSPFFYCLYGSILCGLSGDIEAGYSYGNLGMDLINRLNAKEVMCRTMFVFNVYIRHFKKHVKETVEPLEHAYKVGIETGDLSYAAYCAQAHCVRAYITGFNLAQLKKKMEMYSEKIKDINQPTTLDLLQIYHQAVSNLLESDGDPWVLIGDLYDEQTQLVYHRHADNKFALHYCYFNKLILACLFEKYEEAVLYSDMASKYLDEVTSGLVVPVYHFYDSIACLGACTLFSKEMYDQTIPKVNRNQRKLKKWANHAPMNHLHKFHLVEAEKFRVLGDKKEADHHYEKAIKLANENDYLQEEALANELAGKFYLQNGDEKKAKTFLNKAKKLYTMWGAIRKVKDLEDKYDFHTLMATDGPEKRINTMKKNNADGIDLLTMLKASQAISGEIEVNELIDKYLNIAIENTGAQTGSIVLMASGNLLVKAHCTLETGGVIFDKLLPLKEANNLSELIISYVAKTKKYLVLDDASREGTFTEDKYIKTNQSKSVLCAPILHQNKLVGVIYLENKLLSKAFTPDRLKVLNVLSSQMAISLENALLYSSLKEAEEKYRSIFENAIEGIYQTTPEGRFLDANPAMARLFGYESAEELLEKIYDVEHQLYVNPDRRKRFIKLISEQKFVSGFEVEFYRQDRSTFWASIHSQPVYDENDSLILIQGIITDITDKKRAIEALHEREQHLLEENIRLRSNIKDRYKFGDIIGKSMAMQEVYELILKAASSEVNVIIYGESGTGKELVAREIHNMSKRKEKMFVPVNSGAIPTDLLESEFFGYKKGAFTGAVNDKQGYLELADGGTLFLDELGEMDLNIQAKLLRAIEGRGYTPVGGTKERKTDARIIAATNRDLKEEVRKGLMREDFYYRVHVIPIYLEPLRKRKEDIPLLIDHFLSIHKYEKELHSLSGTIIDEMMGYDWPGNVRELENTLHRYATLKKLEFLKKGNEKQKIASSSDIEEASNAVDLPLKLKSFKDETEKRYLIKLLEQYKWNKSVVAEMLGISRRHLYTKIKKYGIDS